MAHGEGERLHAQRRKRFWTIFAGLTAIGIAGGFLGKIIERHAYSPGDALGPTGTAIAAACVILIAIVALYASYRFFVDVDEVEVADNLWGSLFGLYTYAALLPVWWALNKLGRAPEPDQWVIYGASMIVAMAAYLFRKWRSR